VGDRISMDQAYEISLNSHVVMEPCYPNWGQDFAGNPFPFLLKRI
jgi:hypothetical protein